MIDPKGIKVRPPELRKRDYFPTQIFSHQVDREIVEAFNADLLNHIRQKQAEDAVGIERSNIPQLGGWHSHNHLHKASEFKPLASLVHACAAQISEQLGYHKKHALQIGTMWAIINPPGSANKAHIHPDCLWSGVYYVQTPEDCGNIEFTDPRTQNLMLPPKFEPDQPKVKSCWTKVTMTPEPGKLLIFPSWLYHSVAPNMSKQTGREGERVIVSFNLSQKKAA